MIKTILVGIDGSEHARTATSYGLWLARRLGAHVVGLHVIDIVSIEGSFFHDISGSLGFEPYLDFSSKMRGVLQERGRALLEAFAESAQRENIAAETAMGVGVVANEISERARTADLVVIGHRGLNEKFSTGLLGGTAESVSRKCPKPVFISSDPPAGVPGARARSASSRASSAVCCARQSKRPGWEGTCSTARAALRRKRTNW